MTSPIGIYIHWPYCLSKCPYCDFFSEVKPANQDQIIASYIEDLNFYHDLTLDRTITSIFFGGGTPSLIKPTNIERLINHITKNWKTTKTLEISLEANPNSMLKPPLNLGEARVAANLLAPSNSGEVYQNPSISSLPLDGGGSGWGCNSPSNFFSDIRSAGINRLSLGVQALNDQDLQFLGRTHSLQQALNSIEEVLKTFNNHSIDLIYARPNQQLKDWQKELEQAASFGFKHLSLYQLTIEEGTFFHKQGIKALDEDRALELYNFTEDFLKTKGYNKYEVSNFSQPNYESTHNLGYWQGRDYLGIGPSSHGRLKINSPSLTFPLMGKEELSEAKRGYNSGRGVLCGKEEHKDTFNESMRDEYSSASTNSTTFATTHPRILEPLTQFDRATELLLMGLRLTSGINKKDFQTHCGLTLNTFINQSNLTTLKSQNLITETPTHLKTTPQGLLLLNKILEELTD